MTREEAIEKLKNFADHCYPNEEFLMAIKALEQEPKTGHWIDHQEGRWIYAKCSECETVHDTRTNYCPNCGCHMKNEVQE
ncbi:MAG: hypothetical protein IIY21_11500 [Clostridiales bacterium]|nr:hypothetical protein [Clostridiales bacterium]